MAVKLFTGVRIECLTHCNVVALPPLSFRVRALPKKFRRFPDPILFSSK
jgi:hypothetical protein